MSLYQNLGFSNHPFAQTNADEEPYLTDYFVPPPYFDAVRGDPDHPSASVVLAPRGGGKSAQRRMLELWAGDNDVLAVTYDRFEFQADQDLSGITLQYHLRNLIVRVLVGYLSHLAEDRYLLRHLPEQRRKTLNLFIHSYLGDMTGESLRKVLDQLKSIPQRFREFWEENVGFLEPVVQYLLRAHDLEPIDLPEAKQEEKRLEASYKHQLEVLYEVVESIGFRSIYVLVDKVDETEKTANDPEATYRLMRPLVRDLELLGLDGYGFKFFVWDKILPHFREDARPDRVAQRTLEWTRDLLEEVLSARLAAFSDGTISNFGELVEPSPDYDVDGALCLLANGSPRNLIRLCEKIFAAQAEMSADSETISPEAIDQGSVAHCEEITTELYGTDICRDLKRVGQEAFTINYLANKIFKTAHENTSRNKVTKWREAGVAEKTGSVSIQSADRPVHFYRVVDPAMNRMIHEAVPLEKFLKDRWIECPECGTDNMVSIQYIPDGNEYLCISCNRNVLD